MENIFASFVKEYTDEIEADIHADKRNRCLRNPVIFVFIGDKVIEASKKIYTQVHREWENGEGVFFLNIFSKENLISENMFNFNVDYDSSAVKAVRERIRKNFYASDDKLIELNELMIKIKNKLWDYGKFFTSFKKINIAVVTRADDPLNAITAEITLIAKAKLSQIFNINTADLYTLLVEKNEGEDEFYNGALSVSFLKEIEYFQSREFNFNKKIEVFDKKRKLSVKCNKPLFELLYVLSDTNLNGIVKRKSLEENYNIICYINLIKNRELGVELSFDIKNNIYNDARFKRSIADETGNVSFASAGLAVVKKPYSAAAMTALSFIFEDFINIMKKNTQRIDIEKFLEKFNIDEKSLSEKIEKFMPKSKKLKDMYDGAMIQGQKNLKGLTLGKAEKILYGEACQRFFEANFSVPLETEIRNMNVEKTVEQNLNRMLSDPQEGLYCCYFCTDEEGFIKVIYEMSVKYDKAIQNLQKQIKKIYESPVRYSFLAEILNRSKSAEYVKQQLIEEICARKMAVLKLECRKKLLKKYALALTKYNRSFKEKITEINDLRIQLNDYTLKLIKEYDNYTSQNISKYYRMVTSRKVSALKEKYGEKFYFGEKSLGAASEIMQGGAETLMLKLEQICIKYILSEKEFQMTFEDELKERTNMGAEGVYKKLCILLEENAVPKSLIFEYNVNKYEEKYFFGDYSSDFIKYAYSFDKELKNYPIGYVHQKRTAGIGKLSLFGGFKLNDLVYYRNSLKYYEALEGKAE